MTEEIKSGNHRNRFSTMLLDVKSEMIIKEEPPDSFEEQFCDASCNSLKSGDEIFRLLSNTPGPSSLFVNKSTRDVVLKVKFEGESCQELNTGVENLEAKRPLCKEEKEGYKAEFGDITFRRENIKDGAVCEAKIENSTGRGKEEEDNAIIEAKKERNADDKAKVTRGKPKLNSKSGEEILFHLIEASKFPKVVLQRLNTESVKNSGLRFEDEGDQCRELNTGVEKREDKKPIYEIGLEGNTDRKKSKKHAVCEDKTDSSGRGKEVKDNAINDVIKENNAGDETKVTESNSKQNSKSDEEYLFRLIETSAFPKVVLQRLNTEGGKKTALQENIKLKIKWKSCLKRSSSTYCNRKSFACPECSFECIDQDDLKRHALRHTNPKLKCTTCNFETHDKSLLKRHLLRHSNTKLFKCSDCDYECNQKCNLKLHILKHTHTKLYKCSNCDYECNQKDSLKRHMLKHADIKLYRCADCDYECNYKGNLKIHVLKHMDTKLFERADCGYECSQKDHLKLPMTGAKLFNCFHCNYESNLKSNLNKHILQHHSNIKLFGCSECQFKSNYQGDMKRHLLTHTNIKLFQCSECIYGSNRKSDLKRHLLAHCIQRGNTNIKLFKCSECSYECNRKYRLRDHLLTHKSRHLLYSNTKLFKCSECKYECSQKRYLKCHLLTHLNTKLFKCSECNYECNQKGNLKLHLLAHLNTKLFKCTECDYESNRKDYLKFHSSTHANTVFKCSECDHEFKQKRSLKRHLLSHLNTKLFKCSECDYECNFKDKLKLHLLTHLNTGFGT